MKMCAHNQCTILWYFPTRGVGQKKLMKIKGSFSVDKARYILYLSKLRSRSKKNQQLKLNQSVKIWPILTYLGIIELLIDIILRLLIVFHAYLRAP
jgi:hypothetical protein